MRNPWLAKNPFMSAWLSAANRASNSARGQAAAAVNREAAAARKTATQQVVDFWSGKALTASTAAPKRKRKRKR
jgi:hypothetical protein